MDFELTISGLCVIVLQSKDDYPKKPAGIEVLCPDAHGHRARLTYDPEQAITEIEPALHIDSRGARFASLDLTDIRQPLNLDFGASPPTEFLLDWGDISKEVPEQVAQEKWMSWVPSDQDLGLKGIRVEKDPNKLPTGAAARLILNPGSVEARSTVKNKGTREETERYIKWKFPAVNIKRAVANEVVYRVQGVQHVIVWWGRGGQNEKIFMSHNGTRRMAISNDLAVVSNTYNDPQDKLDHLTHLEVLALDNKKVQAPEISKDDRTGRPICNQIFFVDKS